MLCSVNAIIAGNNSARLDIRQCRQSLLQHAHSVRIVAVAEHSGADVGNEDFLGRQIVDRLQKCQCIRVGKSSYQLPYRLRYHAQCFDVVSLAAKFGFRGAQHR